KDIVLSKPYGHALFASDIKNIINHWLNDTVIDSYIKYLLENISSTAYIESAIMHELINGSKQYVMPPTVQDLFLTDQLIGLYSVGKHWRLLVVYPKKQIIWLIDPFGESSNIMEETKRAWEASMLRSFPSNKNKAWDIIQVEHAKQSDAISCGVICIKFAECVLRHENLPSHFHSDELMNHRQKIAVKLIELGSNGDWCTKICRICDRCDSPPLSKQTGIKPKKWPWVCCDICSPVMWYHGHCVGVTKTQNMKNISFYCNKTIIQDEIVSLQIGETLIRQRKNRRIKRCYGCSDEISESPLDPPHDMVLLQLMRRPKQKCTWDSVKEKDFAIFRLHYHAKKYCIRNLSLDKVKLSRDFQLTEVHRHQLKYLGISYT
uniref:Ubiquitin-like protease family profile domain-containing protein n=3 Tax=Clytia hemisphaerica TaxID=252671 RepID=A0A7M5TR22_9CNID